MKKFDPIESFANMRHEFGEHGGVNMSIEASTTFTVMSADTHAGDLPGAARPRRTRRRLLPLRAPLQPDGLRSGQADRGAGGSRDRLLHRQRDERRSPAAVLQLCNHGEHIVSSDTVYGGTFALFKEFLPAKAGLRVSFVNLSNLDEVEAAFTPETKVLYVETMANPTLRIADLPRLADIAHNHGAQLVVDNTFSPLIISPIRHGADVVIHSLTKFINGASDYIAGAICGSAEFVTSLMDLHLGSLMLLGPTMDPKTAFNISLRLPHLGLRMSEHSRRALYFAERLKKLDVPVVYPGLPDHPDHEMLKRLGNPEFGYGGLLALDLGDAGRAHRFMEILQNKDRFGFMAVSLGYFETLMSCSASSTSSEMSEEDQQKAGIRPGLVRISVGYTGSLEQRWAQLENALEIVEAI